MAFAFAALLRWLTPHKSLESSKSGNRSVFRGWLPKKAAEGATVSYADGLRHNFQEGWYEFKCVCSVWDPDTDQTRNLADWLDIGILLMPLVNMISGVITLIPN